MHALHISQNGVAKAQPCRTAQLPCNSLVRQPGYHYGNMNTDYTNDVFLAQVTMACIWGDHLTTAGGRWQWWRVALYSWTSVLD